MGRGRIVLGLAVVLALVTASCGSPAPTVNPTATATATASARATPSATPRPTTSATIPPSHGATYPSPITARLDLSGPTGYRTTTSAVAADGAIWVTTYQHVGAWLTRIDPAAGVLSWTATLPATLAPAELAAGDDGTLWEAGPVGMTIGAGAGPGTIAQLDPSSGRILASASVALQGAIAVGLGAAWVPSGSGLQELDPRTLRIEHTFPGSGDPVIACGLAVSLRGSTTTLRYLDPATGTTSATVDLGVAGRYLGDDPIDGGPNCLAQVGPKAGGDPATAGSTIAELAAEPTMIIAANSPTFRGDVRFAAGVCWLIANGTMTPVDVLTLAPLGPSWLLPPEITDPSAWTLLGSGQTLWWIGPTLAIRVGIPIPPAQAVGSISAQPWTGTFVPSSMSFSDPDHGIAVGATGNEAGAGVVAVTADGGHSWMMSLLDSPPLAGVSGSGSIVYANAACRIDAPHGCTSSLLRSTDAGRSWEATGTRGFNGVPVFAPGGQLWAVRGTDPTSVTLVSSGDGGRTWQARSTPCSWATRLTPEGVSFATAEVGWLTCIGGVAMGSAPKALFRTTDGGRSWQAVFELAPLNSSPGSNTMLNDELYPGYGAALDMRADGTGWLWTGAGLYQTRDRGASWMLLGFVSGAGEFMMNDFTFFSDTTGLVLVTEIAATPNDVRLDVTHDGGATWSTVDRWLLAP